jgi:hypothetical protein
MIVVTETESLDKWRLVYWSIALDKGTAIQNLTSTLLGTSALIAIFLLSTPEALHLFHEGLFYHCTAFILGSSPSLPLILQGTLWLEHALKCLRGLKR